MALTEKEKAGMRAATHEAASALLDDLAFISEAVNKPVPSRKDVRRISGTLRRLLLENHLTDVAGPRVGALSFPIFDNRAAFTEIDAEFVTVGFAPFYGFENGLFSTFHTNTGGEGFLSLAADDRPIREVKRDTLLSDKVARLGRLEISRADVLKFICHHDFGVHFTGKVADAFSAIKRVRNTLTFYVAEDGALNVIRQDLDTLRPKQALMDLAHAHTFSTAYFLVQAPDVRKLVNVLEAEFAGGEATAEDRPNQS